MKYIATYQVINVVTVTYLVIKYVKDRNINFAIFSYLIFGLVVEIVLAFLEKRFHRSNVISYNLFSFGCVIFYFYFYKNVLIINYKKVYIFMIMVWFSYLLLNTIFFTGLMKLQNDTYILGMITVFIFIFLYMKNLLLIEISKPLYSDYLSWISLGIILFFTSAFPILFFLQKLVVEAEATRAFYNLLNFGNIFLSITFLIAALCPVKDQSHIM